MVGELPGAGAGAGAGVGRRKIVVGRGTVLIAEDVSLSARRLPGFLHGAVQVGLVRAALHGKRRPRARRHPDGRRQQVHRLIRRRGASGMVPWTPSITIRTSSSRSAGRWESGRSPCFPLPVAHHADLPGGRASGKMRSSPEAKKHFAVIDDFLIFHMIDDHGARALPFQRPMDVVFLRDHEGGEGGIGDQQHIGGVGITPMTLPTMPSGVMTAKPF